MSPLPEPGGRRIEIVAERDAPRLDRFLADAVPDLSRARLQALIADGRVAAAGAPARDPAAGVRAGMAYRVDVPPPAAVTPQPQAIPLTILYEDDHLIVLDKQAGLVVHPAPGSPDGTLVNALLAHCGPGLPGIGGERRPGIVHRLDKDTSGIMVVAKSEQAMARLSATFAARDLDRAYLAVCWGQPNPAVGEIDGAIGRDPRDRKRMAVVRGGGKAALTRYRSLRGWFGGATLVECTLATGRTHQIRVHMAARGTPLAGDPLYLRRVPAAARLVPAEARGALLDFPRQALHAARLGFAHPITGAALAFATPPPADLAGLIGVLDRSLQA